MKKNTEEDLKQTKFVRDLIAQFVEEINADSVVVLWTSNSRVGTRARIASYGNQFAVRDMIRTAAQDYAIDQVNSIKDKIEKKPKPKDET